MNTVLPDNILRRLAPEERAKLGKAGMTAAEGRRKADTSLERDLQKLIAQDLNRLGIYFTQARTDKRHTLKLGTPDFMIVLPGGMNLAMEVKVEGGRLSEDQSENFDEYWKRTGRIVYIVWSFDQYRELIEKHLHPLDLAVAP